LTMARLRGQGCSAKLQSAFIPACRFGIGESSQSKHGWGLPVIAEDCDSPSALLVFPATGWCMSNYPFLRGTCPSSQREFAGRCSPSASALSSNILRCLTRGQKSPITTGFARKPPHCEAPAVTRNSLSPAVCLQSSGLRGFSTDLVSD
jgi:hypothetical protein